MHEPAAGSSGTEANDAGQVRSEVAERDLERKRARMGERQASS